MDQKLLKRIEDVVKGSDVLLMTVGAGMTFDSGLPNLRDTKQFHRLYPQLEELGLEYPDVLNAHFLEEEPQLAWGFFLHRAQQFRNKRPHRGYQILKSLAHRFQDYFIVTTNNDEHLTLSGFSEDKIYQVHGDIHYMQCTSCHLTKSLQVDFEVDSHNIELPKDKVPRCSNCKMVMRPNIRMYEDGSLNLTRTQPQAERLQAFLRENREKKIAILEIGVGVDPSTLRMMGESLLTDPKNHLIRVNLDNLKVSFPNVLTENIVAAKTKICELLEALHPVIANQKGRERDSFPPDISCHWRLLKGFKEVTQRSD